MTISTSENQTKTKIGCAVFPRIGRGGKKLVKTDQRFPLFNLDPDTFIITFGNFYNLFHLETQRSNFWCEIAGWPPSANSEWHPLHFQDGFYLKGERVGRSNKNSSAKEIHSEERQHKSPFLILKCQWGPPNHQQRHFPDKILLYCSALSVYARPGVIFYRQFLPFANILQL